ncbi:MAG: YidC/Oxa1 family membrane protein insertase [Oscillospiraceae bacterium]|nr:YidC/Oxa1 family membrane protein insertase [Oscillospiraceae bacterium]
MNPFDLINVPLGLLMKFFYGIFNSYALAILFFAVVVKIVLLPLGIQQQKSQIKMAKIKPKEQAIRGKYAGRSDTATQQKVQSEVMEMYKAENYSPMSGCLPLLVQMPILFSLYAIIRNPLTYIAQLGETVAGIKDYIFEYAENFYGIVSTLGRIGESGTFEKTITEAKNIQEIDIIKIFNDPSLFEQIKANVVGFPANFANLNFKLFGEFLTDSPSEALAAGLSVLLLIPVLNFAASFLQMRLQKMINATTLAGDAANNKGMKIMEYAMPLLIVWMSYSMYSALGLYWIFQSFLGIAQMIALAQIYPLPKISEEEYELARQQYGAPKKKKKKKPATGADGEIIETEAIDIAEEDGPEEPEAKRRLPGAEIKDEKYISKTIPGGISQNVKNNYQKTGKKYTIKKRKK